MSDIGSCEHCKDWSHGRPESIEELAPIQILMSCGCERDVKHSILRCKYECSNNVHERHCFFL